MHLPGAHSTRSQRAFTLAEVMMASVVLLIAIVGLFEAVTIGAGMLNVSRKQSVALQIIRTEIEAVHLDSTWPAGGPATGTIGPVAVDTIDSSSPIGFPELLTLKALGKGFTVSRIVFPVRASPNWVKKITFSVSWSESSGRSYTRTGYTYCAKNGINALYQR